MDLAKSNSPRADAPFAHRITLSMSCQPRPTRSSQRTHQRRSRRTERGTTHGRRQEPRRRRHRGKLGQGRPGSSRAGRTCRSIRYGYAPLPPQTIIDGHIMSAGIAVTEALAQNLPRQQDPIKSDVAVGVYGQSVIVRKITVPMMTNDELDEQISWEAEQHIPFDIKVMSIDYEVLRRRPEAGQMDLLLVAAKRDEINDYAEHFTRGEAPADGRRHQRLHHPEHLRAPAGASRGRKQSRS